MPHAVKQHRWAGGRAVFALGLFIFLFGVPLVIGGVQLMTLDGSWYYLPAGLACVASGVCLMLRRLLGAWIFAGLFVATLAWTLWEVGLSSWALVPRLVAVTVLLLLVIATLPSPDPARPARRLLLAGIAFAVVSGIFIAAFVRNAFEPAAPTDAARTAAVFHDLHAAADWPAYGGTTAAQRYSSLTQVDRDNVGGLEQAWVYRTGDLPDDRWGAETTPLKIGDSLYLCSARNILIALDARSGEERWRYDPEIADESIPYTAACRGVVHFAVPGAIADSTDRVCASRIIEGTLDGRLIAVDAGTGGLCADFGDGGQVDITRGMGRTLPGMVSITSPPAIVRDVLVTGHQVLDGQYRDAPSGVIQAFDAITGELRWAWDMARPDRAGRPAEGETYTRGTPNMWTIATGDDDLGLVYLPMGNSAADYHSRTRTEPENRYATSLVALDVTTGRLAWSFQTVHMDVWDYDLGSQGTLVDFPAASGPVPAIILASKQGDIYILDRRDGRLLTGVEERVVPQGGVEPEQRSPTQPFSLYHTLSKPDLTERRMWGMSPIDQMICRILFRRASYEGIYTPPTAETHWIQYPGYNGGSDWGGVAVDPERGVIVANYNDMPNFNRLVPRAEADRLGWYPRHDPRAKENGAEGAGDPQIGVPYAIDVNAGWRMPFTGLLCKEPPYGGIRAIELATGRTLWDRPLGTARANGPFGIPSLLPLEIGTPNNGGAVLTASGLIFIAAATDNLIRAIDIETGETLWQDVLPAGGQANPMSYEIDGRQYIVIMTGGHHFMETPIGDHVIAYALPVRD